MKQLIAKLYQPKHQLTISQPFNLTVSNTTLEFRFPYNKQLLEEIKQFQGARWKPDHPDGKCWTATNCERNQYALKCLCGVWDSRYYSKGKISGYISTRSIFGHQNEGVVFVLDTRRCMLAFEMGLGKTLTMIEVMEQAGPGLAWWLVAPPGAQYEWKRQLRSWNSSVQPVFTSTYESLHKILDAIPNEKVAELLPDGIIFDESVKIKTPEANRSQIANTLCSLIRLYKPDPYIILLSGAPAPKNPADWWHQIECIQPGFIRQGSWHKFRNHYAIIEQEQGPHGIFPKLIGWREDEVKKLGSRLSPIVLCKRKSDCLDLPRKIRETILLPPSESVVRLATMLTETATTGIGALEKLRELSDGFQYKERPIKKPTGSGEEYKPLARGNNPGLQDNCGQLEQDDQDSVCSNNNLNYLWIGSPKIDAVTNLLNFYHTDNGGPGRLVIYAAFRATIAQLYAEVISQNWDAICIDGGGWRSNLDQFRKDEYLDVFEHSNDLNVCIIANPRCIHGLTLSKTLCLVYYSNDFSVDSRIQSEDRRDRPGMDTSKGTRIIDLIHLDTDKLVLRRLEQGKKLQGITLEEIRRCLSVKEYAKHPHIDKHIENQRRYKDV